MSEKAWSGVFREATDAREEKFTESVSFDRRSYAQDIAASIAHAQMLAKVGLISAEEYQQIEQALAENGLGSQEQLRRDRPCVTAT